MEISFETFILVRLFTSKHCCVLFGYKGKLHQFIIQLNHFRSPQYGKSVPQWQTSCIHWKGKMLARTKRKWKSKLEKYTKQGWKRMLSHSPALVLETCIRKISLCGMERNILNWNVKDDTKRSFTSFVIVLREEIQRWRYLLLSIESVTCWIRNTTFSLVKLIFKIIFESFKTILYFEMVYDPVKTS